MMFWKTKKTQQPRWGRADAKTLLHGLGIPDGEYGVVVQSIPRLRWVKVRLAPHHTPKAGAVRAAVLAELTRQGLLGHCDVYGFQEGEDHECHRLA